MAYVYVVMPVVMSCHVMLSCMSTCWY